MNTSFGAGFVPNEKRARMQSMLEFSEAKNALMTKQEKFERARDNRQSTIESGIKFASEHKKRVNELKEQKYDRLEESWENNFRQTIEKRNEDTKRVKRMYADHHELIEYK